MRKGLVLALDGGFEAVILCGDSLMAIQKLHSGVRIWNELSKTFGG